MKAKKYTVKEIQEKLNLALSPEKPMLQQLDQLGVRELIEELSIYQQELEYQNDELRKTQIDLEKSNRYAEDLFETAPIAYVILNDDFKIMRFNRVFLASFGNTSLEIEKNTDFRRLIGPEDQDDFHRFMMQIGTNEQKNGITLKVSNRYFHIRSQKSSLEKSIEWRVSLTDVHNEQMILAALAHSERRFRNLVHMAPQIIFTMKVESLVLTFMSAYAETLLGLNPVELVGAKFLDIVWREDHSIAQRFLDEIGAMQPGEGPIRSDIRLRNHDGMFCWSALIGQKIWDAASGKSYYLCIAHPMDQLKRQQLALEEQNDRLQHFSHILSHNLRSYVANIHSLVDLMGEESMIETEKAELYPSLKQATSNLQEAIDHLNEVLKIQKNGHLGKEKLFLKKEIDKVLAALGKDLEHEALKVQVKIDENMVVCFQPAYLQSILLNMCSNALRYKRPIENAYLRIAAREMATQTISIVFEDNGQGMDLHTMGHKLFGMFQTFHEHPDSKGLGLFMVKNQLAAMGGEVKVESRVGEGTKFELLVPGCVELRDTDVAS